MMARKLDAAAVRRLLVSAAGDEWWPLVAGRDVDREVGEVGA